jgi:hypothetical protein
VALLKGGEHAFGGRHDPARECVSGSGVLNGRFVLARANGRRTKSANGRNRERWSGYSAAGSRSV